MSTPTYSELDSKEGRDWNRLCSPEIYDEGYIKLGPVNGVFARSYLEFYERIKSFKVRDDDVWIVSFPKTGTTWTQEMVWLLMHDFDFEGAKADLGKRAPYFEVRANWSPRLASLITAQVLGPDASATDKIPEEKAFFLNSFDLADNLESPRCVKSHLHFSLLPEDLIQGKTGAKMIYVTRNPKDTCISFYHHSCLLDGYSGTLEEFTEQFITDNVFCAPFWTHVREFWELKDKRKDLLFLTYEELKKDLPGVIRKTAAFLGKSITEAQVSKLVDHLSFESMKVNPYVNQEAVVEGLRKIHGRYHDSTFMRKGKVGSWREELSGDLLARLDQWVEKEGIPGLY